jgi:hypothetical protein
MAAQRSSRERDCLIAQTAADPGRSQGRPKPARPAREPLTAAASGGYLTHYLNPTPRRPYSLSDQVLSLTVECSWGVFELIASATCSFGGSSFIAVISTGVPQVFEYLHRLHDTAWEREQTIVSLYARELRADWSSAQR